MPFYSVPPAYERVRRHIYDLKTRIALPALRVLPVGRSLLGRGIYAITIGNPMEANLMVGGVHGSEWITTLLMLRFADRLGEALRTGGCLSGMDVSRIGGERSVVIVPALNPAGIEIALAGAEAALFCQKEVTRMAGDTDLSRWQANARGVDLNHNFAAGWDILHQMEQAAGITGPGPTKYGGTAPHSEPETRAIVHFIQSYRPRNLYAFHAQGEEIYCRYGENTPPASVIIGELLSDLSGYALLDSEGTASHGGLKDWFIETYGRPGFTFEVGRGQNPLPIKDFPALYERLEKALIMVAML